MNSKLRDRIKRIELQNRASGLRLREGKDYTRDELVVLARVAGVQYIGEKTNVVFH